MDGAHTFVQIRNVWKKVVKSKGLERSFKQAIPQEVYESLEKEMTELETR